MIHLISLGKFYDRFLLNCKAILNNRIKFIDFQLIFLNDAGGDKVNRESVFNPPIHSMP